MQIKGRAVKTTIAIMSEYLNYWKSESAKYLTMLAVC